MSGIEMKSATKNALRYILIALIGATIIGLIEGVQVRMGSVNAGRPLSWGRSFTTTMPSWYVLAALIPWVIFIAKRYPYESLRRPRSILVHLGAAFIFASAFLLFTSYISDYLLYKKMPVAFMSNLWRLFGIYFVGIMMQYAGVVGFYFAVDYSRRYREKERAASELALKASRLESSLARANLEALRMQLNPHFLFNTLNTISVLALKGERQRVARMLSRLSDLLRLSLENDRQTLSLREELDFLERYLEIEEVRFRDRLTIDKDVEDAAYDAEVPSLVLQPLVENAIKYGFSQTIGPGRVSITCRVRSGMLEMEVADTGPGFPECQTNSESTGVGIANTRARLEQLYGGNYTLELINRPEGGALVKIRMPYIRKSDQQPGDIVARQA
jgi:two-component system, LytTR family, sensor kinase